MADPVHPYERSSSRSQVFCEALLANLSHQGPRECALAGNSAHELPSLSRVYGFWKHSLNIEREEIRAYLEMFPGLMCRPLAVVQEPGSDPQISGLRCEAGDAASATR